jgi:tetrahydromethanopterin S-methyltransferase subunit D
MSRKYEVHGRRLALRIAAFLAIIAPWLIGMFTLNLALASFGIGLMFGFIVSRWDALPKPVIKRIDDEEDA